MGKCVRYFFQYYTRATIGRPQYVVEAEIILGDLIDLVYSIDYLHISLNLKLYQNLGMAGYFYSTQEVGLM